MKEEVKNYTILTPHPFPTSSSAFVYGDGIGEEDLARQATDTFAPLDGLFNDNVIIQVSELKNYYYYYLQY